MARPDRRRSRKTSNRNKKTNGPIKQTKLEGVNSLGSLAVAFAGVAMVL